jgi:hypothetical protein
MLNKTYISAAPLKLLILATFSIPPRTVLSSQTLDCETGQQHNLSKIKSDLCRIERTDHVRVIMQTYLRNYIPCFACSPLDSRQEQQVLPIVQSVPTDCSAHPAPYTMGTTVSFPSGKAAGAWDWPLSSTLCGMKNERICTFVHPHVFVVLRDIFTFTLLLTIQCKSAVCTTP